MVYDTWSPYDPSEADTPEDVSRLRQRLQHSQQAMRTMLPLLRQEIEDPDRDGNSVHKVLRPYYDNGRDMPMTPADVPEIESLCRLVLERGGLRQNEIQEVLIRLIGATALPESAPFLLEMLRYTRRGDHFGPERRQLALWGLGRVAIFHNIPETYAALREALDDRRAEVRITATDLTLDAYLSAHRAVPQDVVDKLHEMARSDPDDDVRRTIKRFLHKPWSQSQ
jgi:hypothetical protein